MATMQVRYKIMVVPEPRTINVCPEHFTEMQAAEKIGVLREIQVMNAEGLVHVTPSIKD